MGSQGIGALAFSPEARMSEPTKPSGDGQKTSPADTWDEIDLSYPAPSEEGRFDWAETVEARRFDPLLDETSDETATVEFPAPIKPQTIGWKTYLDLPDHAITGIDARCFTGSPGSVFLGQFTLVNDQAISLSLHTKTIEFPVSERDSQFFSTLTVQVAGRTFPLFVRLENGPGPARIVLGRNALMGRFTVDVSQ